MWYLGNRALWYSALWIWGKTGLIVWTGSPVQNPSKTIPPAQLVAAPSALPTAPSKLAVAKTSKHKHTNHFHGDMSWWEKQVGGDVTARDARAFQVIASSRVHDVSSERNARFKSPKRSASPSKQLKSKLSPNRLRALEKGRFFLTSPLPGARVGSGYGWRIGPISGKMGFHRGWDYGASFGASVLAAAPGYVRRIGWMGSCGLGVVIVHRSGVTTCYCHLSQILASHRSYVKRGEIIGEIGSTGSSTSPHLHFSVLYRRSFVDPARFMHPDEIK